MLSKPVRRRQASPTPKLSVVVPVYNVADYLPDCLDSILDQDFTGLEVVMVDDGSTDGSAEVAADYVRRHPHLTLVRSANQGPGAARNLGVMHCTGEFLGFADSDDLVLPHAYEVMVSTLEESSSDFAVASVQRLVEGGVIEPPLLRSLHRQRRLGLTVDDDPEIITDCFAWNKVFRRSFWDRAGLEFPSGLRYEDQVTITEAYLRAEAFDVLRRPVYLWRVRSDGSSITQRRHELADLDDRLVTKQMTTELVTRLASPHVRDSWLSRGLGGDLPLYFRHIPGCSDDYWQRLVTGVRDIFAGHPPIWESRALRVHNRLGGWLVTHDRRAEAETIYRWVEQHPGPLPLETRADHVVALLPFHDDPESGIPEQLYWLAEHELRFDARLLGVRDNDGCVEVSGFALIRGAPSEGVEYAVAAALCSPTGERLALEVQHLPSPQATSWVDRLPQRYDDCGFVARVDPTQLCLGPRGRGASRWVLELSVTVAGISRGGRLRSKAPDVTLPLAIEDGSGLLATFERADGLVLSVTKTD